MSSMPPQGIEVFRGRDLVPDGTVSINSVVRPSLERMLRRSLHDALVRLYLLPVPGKSVDRGSPSLHNLMPDLGYAYVIVIVGGRVIYQHPHPIEDLLAEQLRRVLRERQPSEEMWGFRLAVQRRERAGTVRPTPQVHGAVEVTHSAEPPSFGIRRLSEEPPPRASLQEFAIEANGGDRAAPIKVLLTADLARDIATRQLSSEVEEGGFLIGRVYRESDTDDETFIVQLTGAESADYTGASFLHFTFTGDSFAAVKRTLRETRPGDRLLGWYHTHLFPATAEMGLSTIDESLHRTTFTLPWQIAGLLNLDRDERTLRFYAWRGEEMIRCPHWVLHA